MFDSNDYYLSTGEIYSPCSHTPSGSADWGSSSGWHSWIPKAWWDHTESRASCRWPPPCLETQCADKTIWSVYAHLIVTGTMRPSRQNNSTQEHNNKLPRLPNVVLFRNKLYPPVSHLLCWPTLWRSLQSHSLDLVKDTTCKKLANPDGGPRTSQNGRGHTTT